MSMTPGNIIKTPDFLGLAQARQNQLRKEKIATASYLKDYEQTGDSYLEGLIPGVQSAWNQVQQAMSDVAADDNANTRMALSNANSFYKKTAGQAKYLTDEYRTLENSYRNAPGDYGIVPENANRMLYNYRYGVRATPGQVMSENALAFEKSVEFDLMNPMDQAKVIYDRTSERRAEFTKNGVLNMPKYTEVVQDIVTPLLSNPDNFEKAYVYGALKSGATQSRDEIMSQSELDYLRALPDETKAKYAQIWLDDFDGALDPMIRRTDDSDLTAEERRMSAFKAPTMMVYGDPRNPVLDGAVGVNVKPIETTNQYGGVGPAPTQADVAQDMYDEPYEDLSSKEQSIVDSELKVRIKDHQNKIPALGRSIEVAEKIVEAYYKDGEYYVKTESKIDDSATAKKIKALQALSNGTIVLSEDDEKMVTIRKAQPHEVADLESAGVDRAIRRGVRSDVMDPIDLDINSVTSQDDRLNIR